MSRDLARIAERSKYYQRRLSDIDLEEGLAAIMDGSLDTKDHLDLSLMAAMLRQDMSERVSSLTVPTYEAACRLADFLRCHKDLFVVGAISRYSDLGYKLFFSPVEKDESEEVSDEDFREAVIDIAASLSKLVKLLEGDL